MVDYSEAANREAEIFTADNIKYIKDKSYLSEADKEQEIKAAEKDKEYRLQLNKAIAKIISQEGPDFFNSSEDTQEQKLAEALIKEGVLKDKPYEDGSGSRIVFPDGAHIYPPANDAHFLANRAGLMVQQEAFTRADTMKKDLLNVNSSSEVRNFVSDYNQQKTVSAMRKKCMLFVEQQANNPRSFTADSLDMTVKISDNAQNRSIVSEEDFKGLLAERKRSLDKIEEFKNNPNQHFYGEGLMAQKNPETSEITFTVEGKPVDKQTFQQLVNIHNFSEHKNNKLTAGVQYGSLIAVYNPESKDASNNFKEMKWLASDGKGGLKEVSTEEAGKIYNTEKLTGKDISPKKIEVTNYGGGLMQLKNQNGGSLYVNANNITHPNTGLSNNMVRNKYMEGGR